jgi:hypothetical protein
MHDAILLVVHAYQALVGALQLLSHPLLRNFETSLLGSCSVLLMIFRIHVQHQHALGLVERAYQVSLLAASVPFCCGKQFDSSR